MAFINGCLLVLALALAILIGKHAGDPDIMTDYIVPLGGTADAELFTYRGLRDVLWAPAPTSGFNGTRPGEEEFRGLTGLGVSLAVLHFAPGAVNTPHIHQRASELIMVLQGCLVVSFVDTITNKVLSQTLQTGDMFVFPKGLVHFQTNYDQVYPAVAVSAFGSSSAGTVSLPKTLFGSGIDSRVLAKSFNTDEETINKLIYSVSN